MMSRQSCASWHRKCRAESWLCAGTGLSKLYCGERCVSEFALPDAGETSASLLRLLAAGKVTFVTRTGAYAELPDNVCVKIEPDAFEKQLLVEYLDYFAARPDARTAMGTTARRYVQEHHTMQAAARAYNDFLIQFIETGRTTDDEGRWALHLG